MSDALTFEDLQNITGYRQAGDVERCLRDQKIKYFWGKGGKPWTTMHHLNHPGGQVHTQTNHDPIQF